MTKWKEHQDEIEKGPMEGFKKIGITFLAIFIIITTTGYFIGWFGDAATTMKKEFAPSVALKKYEWFKDASAQLIKKEADIKVYQSRLDSLKTDYAEVKRKDWDRTDKETFSKWQSEVAGVKASYNGLAAEYNAASSKFNWKMFETSLDAPVKTFQTF